MAQFAVQGTWRSILAMSMLFAFVGLLVFAMAGGFPKTEMHSLSWGGLFLYVFAILTIGFGFWSKEDVVAVLGIMSLSGLIILDILLRVGLLSYNGVKII